MLRATNIFKRVESVLPTPMGHAKDLERNNGTPLIVSGQIMTNIQDVQLQLDEDLLALSPEELVLEEKPVSHTDQHKGWLVQQLDSYEVLRKALEERIKADKIELEQICRCIQSVKTGLDALDLRPIDKLTAAGKRVEKHDKTEGK